MLRIYLLLFVLGYTKLLYTQSYDRIWLLGQDSQSDLEHAGIVLDFFNDTLIVYSEFRDTYFRQVNASICDNNGNVLFSTNGLKIYDSTGITMTNGDGLNPGALADEWIDVGYSLHQGALSLPLPEKQNEYILFHKDLERNLNLFRIETHHFYYSLIDVGNSSETSEVKEKNFALLDELLATGKITAVQHANGRDWWIPVRRYSSNEYYMFLLSREGVENTGIQVIGDSIPSGSLGQAVFSPDGTKYIQTNLHGSQGDPIYINIYDFDRCSGELYNPIQFTYADSAVCLGAAISPNSRFLYVSSWIYVYQYDLWADDIEASRITVAEWDGFADEGIFSNTFYLAQLAPNGKIYINSNNGTKHLHVINQPDSLGLACEVCQHCVELPSWNSFSMPNFPNYRLGHEEGSACDTLREPPTAAWNHEPDLLSVSFHNESQHDIRSYNWSFGDGATSTLAHPQHTYAVAGVYEVCLSVSNPRGTDSSCQNVNVMTTGVEEAMVVGGGLSISPNPSNGRELQVACPTVNSEAQLRLTSIHGQLLQVWDVAAQQASLNLLLDDLPPGLYFLQWSSGEEISTTKLILQ